MVCDVWTVEILVIRDEIIAGALEQSTSSSIGWRDRALCIFGQIGDWIGEGIFRLRQSLSQSCQSEPMVAQYCRVTYWIFGVLELFRNPNWQIDLHPRDQNLPTVEVSGPERYLFPFRTS